MALATFQGKPDWFSVNAASLDHLPVIIGLKQLPGGRGLVHRSHLPLMTGDDDALLHLVGCALSSKGESASLRWEARDRATAGRGFKLRPHQQAAVDFMMERRGTLLGDEPRVGKTLAAIMTHDPSTGPLVVICPANVRPVWIGWMRKVFPGEPIAALKGKKFDLDLVRDKKLIVGHYEILPGWQWAAKFGTLVFDEAHALTNPRAQRTLGAAFLAMRAERVICATGTPIWNMPPDLWSVLGLVAPGAFGSFHEFAQRYGDPEPTAHGTRYRGVSNGDELAARLTQVMIRRRWIDIKANLPPITRSVSLVELTEAQQRKLDILAAEAMSKGGSPSTIGVLVRYRKVVSMTKAWAAAVEAGKVIARGEPVVVWTWHKKAAEAIAEELGEAGFLLHGDVPQGQREAIIEGWRSRPAAALVCTMAVAQVGLDFSHARMAIFAELDYTPAVIAQAEMRTFAPERPMDVTFIVADHHTDQRIVLALAKKLAASSPLGVSAGDGAIDVLRLALQGPVDEGSLDRLLEDLLGA